MDGSAAEHKKGAHLEELKGLKDAANNRRRVHATMMRDRMANRRARVLKKVADEQEQELSTV